jgi:hypothetical protein
VIAVRCAAADPSASPGPGWPHRPAVRRRAGPAVRRGEEEEEEKEEKEEKEEEEEEKKEEE